MSNEHLNAGPNAGPQCIIASRSVVLRNGEPFALVPSRYTNHVRVERLGDGVPVATLLRSETLRLVLEGEVRVGPVVYQLTPDLHLVQPPLPEKLKRPYNRRRRA
ncbi:MAG: hypothetical protein KJ648_07510 [Candidatus Omnitrophica bacterium]|nr:hypothetical protein [Candidatus Omnitrophota bacterium]